MPEDFGVGGRGRQGQKPKSSEDMSFFTKTPLNVPFSKMLNLK